MDLRTYVDCRYVELHSSRLPVLDVPDYCAALGHMSCVIVQSLPILHTITTNPHCVCLVCHCIHTATAPLLPHRTH
jgi:hypothetical protein